MGKIRQLPSTTDAVSRLLQQHGRRPLPTPVGQLDQHERKHTGHTSTGRVHEPPDARHAQLPDAIIPLYAYA